ncbi:hypothetical protein PIROE2DRAFT_8760 [Piromyces sp. E2]|nr:hypothetical protein PIROE2DRAFT_8760 [Piromyces sp. E2]|eukprot:OUM64453.1 hypothetical protein PIROE2DRAFT_8760 [Piromyces sp. E2]
MLLTLKALLQSDELCDKFLNYDGMNLLCKYINPMPNIKKNHYYNNNNNRCNGINNKILYDVPVTPHQSLGDLNDIDKEIMENNLNHSNANVNSDNYNSQCDLNSTEIDENSTSQTNNINKDNNNNISKNAYFDFDSVYTIIEIFIYLIDTRKRNDAIMEMAHKVSI